MKKMLFYLTMTVLINGIVVGSPGKEEHIFKRITKDEPTGKAVLVFSVKILNSANRISGSDVCISRNAKVYSCRMEWYTPKRDPDTKMYSGEMMYCYTTDPGEFDINMIEIETTNGSYGSSVSYPLSGTFRLESGTIHNLGVIAVDLSESTCSLLQDETHFAFVGNQFRKDFPTMAGAVSGIIGTPVTAPAPYATAGTLFTDDFSEGNSGWRFYASNLHQNTIADGILLLDNQGADSSVATKTISFPASFDVQTECTWQSGETNKGYGLIIGNDPVTCLKFTLTSGGYFSIFRWLPKKDLQWISQNVVGWTKTGAIHTGPGAKNVIRVQKIEWYMHTVGMIAFYINDNLVARNVYYLYPPTGGSGTQFKKEGVVGLFSYGKQVIAWDNFKVSDL